MLFAAFSWRDQTGTAAEVSTLIRGTGGFALPAIDKVGGSVDRVNGQLDKVGRNTGSAVEAAV